MSLNLNDSACNVIKAHCSISFLSEQQSEKLPACIDTPNNFTKSSLFVGLPSISALETV